MMRKIEGFFDDEKIGVFLEIRVVCGKCKYLTGFFELQEFFNFVNFSSNFLFSLKI
jgi:hypothetical protein